MMSYFKLDEFKCRCGKCGTPVDKMDKDFLGLLDDAREYANIPFIITSGYRCPTWNMIQGGKDNSAHKYGLAADIQCLTSKERFLMIDALLTVGFERIGVGRGFIHVDLDTSKPAEVMWDYYK